MANVFTPAIKTDTEAQKRVRKWIRALRSGAYHQTSGQLRFRNEYCCLGVACDLLDPDGWIMTDDRRPFHKTNGATTFTTLDKSQKTYRLTLSGVRGLASMNDQGSTFKDIAARLSADLRARLAA